MAPYDSDSSGDEDVDFTETDVLLGYADKEPKDELVSRLGGRPEWLSPDQPPSAALAKCKNCKTLLVLLLQLNGDLPKLFPGHERRLYVFACRNKACRRKDGSIRAIRNMRGSSQASITKQSDKKANEGTAETKPKTTAPPATGLGESLFGAKSMGQSTGSANPFSSSGSANPFSSKPVSASANPFSTKPASADHPQPKPSAAETVAETVKELPKTFAETLNLNNPQTPTGPPPPPEPWPPEDAQPKPYPVMWIADAEYETLDPTPLPAVPQQTTMDIDEPGGGGSGKEDKEVFESSMDSTFQKFADRIGQNPDQVIRYEFGGAPLLYSKDDAIGKMLGGQSATGGAPRSGGGMPRCGNCGAARTFEVQMTPNAIAELEAEEDDLEGMDWGTIIVGVCEKDCQERSAKDGEAGYLEEWVGVQWEELTARR